MSENGEDDDRVVLAESERDDARRERGSMFWWISAFVLFLIIGYVNPTLSNDGTPPAWVTTLPLGSLLYELRIGFGSTLITFFALTVFYDIYLKRHGTKDLERGLIGALSGNARLFGLIGTDAKTKHVKNGLDSLLGSEFGTALYKDMVEPIVDSPAGYRSKYNYNVTMLEIEQYPDVSSFDGLSDLVNPQNYHWIQEEIEYRAHTSKGTVFWGPYSIALAFDKQTLQELYADPKDYFRSMVELDSNSKEAFFSQPNDDIARFVAEAMGLSLSETRGGRTMQSTISVQRTPSGSPIIYVTTDEIADKSDYNKLRVQFIYPHKRDATHFTYSMPQPCKSPRMIFRCSSQIEDLEYIDYFSKIPNERRSIKRISASAKLHGYEVEIDGWVFPMSGITFTWRNKPMVRQIANLIFNGSRMRIYLAWSGAGNGESELQKAMREIETSAGPESSTIQEFRRAAEETFRNQGFQVFKG